MRGTTLKLTMKPVRSNAARKCRNAVCRLNTLVIRPQRLLSYCLDRVAAFDGVSAES